MIRKTISFILSALFVVATVSVGTAAFAYDTVGQSRTIIETYEDGSYGVVTVTEFQSETRATKNGQKKYEYYNSSNVKQWTVYLNASFTYTGSSATCTSATPSYSINNNTWSVTKALASRSGATATGTFTVKQYGIFTVDKTLTLTCSASGVLS